MSIVKWGQDNSGDNSQPLRFGQFYWGQPNSFYIYDNLLEYLPTFVVRNNICKGILKAIAKVLLEWQIALANAKTYRTEGKGGITNANSNWKLFLNYTPTNTVLKEFLADIYNIHQARGTKAGIVEDLKRASGDQNAGYEFEDEEHCGWWIEQTYPEINKDGYADVSSASTYNDLDNLITVKYANKSKLTYKEIDRIITDELIPVTLNLVIKYITPAVVQFGQFRFGEHEFGEEINA